MRTYGPDQWLRHWFLGGPPDVRYGSEGQLTRQPNQAAFVSALAGVWRAVAARCVPGARLDDTVYSSGGRAVRPSAAGRAVQRQPTRYRPGC